MKLSAEFLILFIATIAVAGFVASQFIPLIQQSAQTANAVVTDVVLYDKKIFLTVKNVGSVEVTGLQVIAYQGSTQVWSNSWSGITMAPGMEQSFEADVNGITAGNTYRVVVKCTFAGAGEKVVYSQKLVALAW